MAKKPEAPKRGGPNVTARVADEVAVFLSELSKEFNWDKKTFITYGLQLIAEKHGLEFPKEHMVRFLANAAPKK